MLTMELGGNNHTFSNVFSTSQSTQQFVTDISLNGTDTHSGIKIPKAPQKVLHFSDGTLEQYSSAEEDEVDVAPAGYSTEINPKSLAWVPWMWYQTTIFGSLSLKVCDYLGELLANFFGITTPKYQYEIDEYKRMLAEEEESKKKEDIEMRGWTTKSSSESGDTVHTAQTLQENSCSNLVNQRY